MVGDMCILFCNSKFILPIGVVWELRKINQSENTKWILVLCGNNKRELRTINLQEEAKVFDNVFGIDTGAVWDLPLCDFSIGGVDDQWGYVLVV